MMKPEVSRRENIVRPHCVPGLGALLMLVAVAQAGYYRAPTGELPQTDQPMNVWVYFTDKGFQTEDLANRVLARCAPKLDERTMERRLQALGVPCDFDDITPYERYVSAITELAAS